ncbi:MAG: hypothetical protein DHS20C18_35430 [Saprospiraceae bacterium]|nr:MAG: hypothetical protein DHS20C18_35430 [Saprospiraceae bacterium]
MTFDFIDSSKILKDVLILPGLITLIFFLASCSENNDPIEAINDSIYIPDKQFESILIEQTIDPGQNSNLSHLYLSSNSLADRNPHLSCIHINNEQDIPTVSLSEYQELSTSCN